jgi:HEPN domain-containing protein
MPSDTPIPGSPADWLRYARSDLALARQHGLPELLLETLCFHAQQAVEKNLKAVFVHQGMVFPYTHDLAQLITRAKASGISWPEALNAAADLTEYAVSSRYPGVYERVTDEDDHEAIEVAQCVVNWANNIVRPTE